MVRDDRLEMISLLRELHNISGFSFDIRCQVNEMKPTQRNCRRTAYPKLCRASEMYRK